MSNSINAERPTGFLPMCFCIVLLAVYWLGVPMWKYGSYAHLGVIGGCGCLVALTAPKGYRLLGAVVLSGALLLGFATYDARKAYAAKREKFRNQAEARMMEALSKETPSPPEREVR